MNKDLNTYIPFVHDNFDFKKGVIELARKQPNTFEGIHTATLIYVNSIDYISRHLLENLLHMTYLVTHYELSAIVFVKPLKNLIHDL